jgi:hypothetical protein
MRRIGGLWKNIWGGYYVAILTTEAKNMSARSLYSNLGWQTIKEPFYVLPDGEPYIIMGKKLERKPYKSMLD